MSQAPQASFRMQLSQLGKRQQLAFMATLCERLIPNYALFTWAPDDVDAARTDLLCC